MPSRLGAYRDNGPYVFVSYSHADEEGVYAEIRWLQEQGINLWYDSAGIDAGAEWNDQVAQAIKGATSFLFFLSPRSVASEHCRRELNFAQSEGRRIIVVQMTKTEVPDGLRLSLYTRQAVLKHRLSDAEYKSSLLHFLRAGSLGVLDEAATRASTAGSTPPQTQDRIWLQPGACSVVDHFAGCGVVVVRCIAR
jgi:hypothetical protein